MTSCALARCGDDAVVANSVANYFDTGMDGGTMVIYQHSPGDVCGLPGFQKERTRALNVSRFIFCQNVPPRKYITMVSMVVTCCFQNARSAKTLARRLGENEPTGEVVASPGT
jgi:hypothetical protein